jgi:polysaccharide biosynthesis protein PslH
MKILVLAVDNPFPPIGGGLMRNYQLMKALSKSHEITLVTFEMGRETTKPSLAVKHITVQWQSPLLYEQMNSAEPNVCMEAYYRLALDYDLPWLASYLESKEMEDTLKNVCKEEEFDLIMIEEVQMAQFIPVLPAKVPKIVDFHNVYSYMQERVLIDLSDESYRYGKIEYERMLRFEKMASSYCAHSLVCSEKEAFAARKYLECDQITVIPNGVDTNYFKPEKIAQVPGSLLFTGSMFYPPNVEGVKWFVTNVFPIIQKEVPNVSFHVVGTSPTTEILALASESIIIHGRVEDIRPFYQQAEVFVVPLLSGGGTRLKILEAAAAGKAIVTTSLGVEGLDFNHEEELLIEDDAIQFANAVIHLLTNDNKRKRLEKTVREPALNYDWEIIGSKLEKVICEVTATEQFEASVTSSATVRK